MSHYKINDYEIAKAKLQVKATILNLAKEIELTEFLQTIQYTGQLNKRFETAVNKALAEKYGTWHYQDRNPGESWSSDEPNKEFNNVSAYLSSETYSKKYFKLGVSYKGTDVTRDYDAKKDVLGTSNERLEFYTWETLDELRQQLASRITYLKTELEKVKDNQKHLDKYAREHDAIVEKLNAYNDKISYAIAETYRIK